MSLPLLADPTAWAGRSYATPLSLDLATLQTTIVSTLVTTFAGTPIGAFGFPQQPDDSWWGLGNIGYVLVAYKRAEYGEPLATSAMLQERRADFEIKVIARQVAWADFTSSGVFQALLQVVKSSLTGLSIPGWRNAYFTSEEFAEQDPQGRIWDYSMRYRVVTMELKQEPSLALATLKEILYLERGGLTTTPAEATAYTFDTDGTISLPNGNVFDVIVSNVTTGAPYVLATDYSIETAVGVITALSGGQLGPNVTVNIAYSYGEIVTCD